MNKIFADMMKQPKKTNEFLECIDHTAKDDAERYVAAVMEANDDLEQVERLFRSMFLSWLKGGSNASYIFYEYTAYSCGMLMRRMVKILAEAEDSSFYDMYFAQFMVCVYSEYAAALKDLGFNDDQIQRKIMEAMPDGKYGICGFDIPE